MKLSVLSNFGLVVLPRKALGMVILSHMRSLTSRPDSGEAMALATDAMSECSDKLKSSKPGRKTERAFKESPKRKEVQTFEDKHTSG